jgi:ATP/maltotriose-dependent transcriptional regulator MalT
VHRAVVLKRRGSLAEAESEAAQACDELITSHVANAAAAFAEVGDIRRRLGDFDRAEAAFTKAHELSGRPCGALALLRLAQGRSDSGLTIITSCLRATTNRLARAALLPTLVQVATATGDLDEAEDALGELDDITATFDTPILRAAAASTRGRLELAQGDAAAACTTLQEAIELWSALDVPYEVATARTLLGQALRDCGDVTGAAEAFAAAASLFDDIGAHLDARVSESGVSPTLPAGLTEREVEVLRLVAAGKTNNEVAAELYLSVKTVSRHLSNIFTKVGVTSRAAATAFAFEHNLVANRR